MSKRSANDEDSNPSRKRQKTRRKLDSITDDIFDLVEMVNSKFPDGKEHHRLDKQYLKDMVLEMERSTSIPDAAKSFDEVKNYLLLYKEVTEKDTSLLAVVRLPVLYRLGAIDQLLDEFKDNLSIKPSPSSYAKRAGWEVAQQLPGAILCLRPSGKQGMPLILLREVFSCFQQYRLRDLPASLEGSRILQVALGLCDIMGDAIKNEDARINEIDFRIKPLLLKGLVGHAVSRDATLLPRGRVYFANNSPLMIIESKSEYETGDAYFQVARSYDLVCETLGESDRRQGAPAFLLSIMGPSLTISGGFIDGSHTVVEPLCAPLLMLEDKDRHKGRAVQLAQHLFALKVCLETLREDTTSIDVLGSNTPRLIPGCPRVFPSFKDKAGGTHFLQFTKALSDERLQFAADVVNGDITKKALVKVVYGHYGEEVHAILSKAKMAPKLFGTASIEGGPIMIAMEMLDDGEWKPLYKFASGRDASFSSAVGRQLRAIVKMLGDNGLVHGDIRSNNVMAKMDGSQCMLVDFDWAGKAGEVKYPLARNEEITWPSPVGSPIRVEDDLTMLDDLLKEFSVS